MMNWKKYLPHISIFGILLIISIGLFPDALKGKVVNQPDIINFKGMGSDVIEHKKETGELSLWTNSSFSGMPTYIWGGATYNGNKLKPLQRHILSLKLPPPIYIFFIGFVCFFVLMLTMRINPWIGLVGSLAFGLCTYNFLLSETGHTSKLLAIVYFPLIAAGSILVYRTRYLLGSVVFGLGLGLNLMAGHIQMTYYFAICMAVYVVAQFVEALKKKELAQFAKSSAILFIPLLLAVGSNSSRLWTNYEYMQETIRGPQILTVQEGNNKGGLDKDYVFEWSHGITESVSFIVPGAFGGGSSEPIDESYATYKDLKRKGVSRAGLKTAPLYWGDLPSTSGPIYFGAISWLLFILGLLLVRGHLKWWLAVSTGLVIMLSWGKNFMGFNELFYNYFPLYNKFRAVSSILAVLQFTVPFLGVLALKELLSEKLDREAVLKKLYMALGIVGGFVVLFGIFGGAFYDFAGRIDPRLESSGFNMAAVVADRKMLLQGDSIRSLLYILLSGGLLWAFLKEKVIKNSSILFGVMALLMLLDLGGVGKRYLNSDNFLKPRQYQENFAERPVDKQILQDTDPHFRVFDMSINTFNSNKASNFHKTIGGYHAAKIRRYQDIIERQIGSGNQKVLDMLNSKYFISQNQQVQRNPNALGNVWFVNNIQMAQSHDDEMNGLEAFNPSETAIVHSEFEDYLGGFQGGDGTGSIQLSSYTPNHFTYTSNSSSEQFAVFSEVIYKPNHGSGWKSYIDGQPVDHIRANYVLRAMKIPAGEHTIEFKFDPASYNIGELISLICSLILILGIFVYGYTRWKASKSA